MTKPFPLYCALISLIFTQSAFAGKKTADAPVPVRGGEVVVVGADPSSSTSVDVRVNFDGASFGNDSKITQCKKLKGCPEKSSFYVTGGKLYLRMADPKAPLELGGLKGPWADGVSATGRGLGVWRAQFDVAAAWEGETVRYVETGVFCGISEGFSWNCFKNWYELKLAAAASQGASFMVVRSN